jgi:hypothetical protein
MSQSKIANRRSSVYQESFLRWDWHYREREMIPATAKAPPWRSAVPSHVRRIRQLQHRQ